MNRIKTKPFDTAQYLDDSESTAAYMGDALGSENPAFLADASGVVARARSMSKVQPRRVAGPLVRSSGKLGPEFPKGENPHDL